MTNGVANLRNIGSMIFLVFLQVIFVVDCNSLPEHKCASQISSEKQPANDQLQPDHFKQLGKVRDMKECIDKCCGVEHCDLAMMSYGGQNCYGVACFSENLCQLLPSYPTRISFDVAHVSRRWDLYGNTLVKIKIKRSEKDGKFLHDRGGEKFTFLMPLVNQGEIKRSV